MYVQLITQSKRIIWSFAEFLDYPASDWVAYYIYDFLEETLRIRSLSSDIVTPILVVNQRLYTYREFIKLLNTIKTASRSVFWVVFVEYLPYFFWRSVQWA